MKNKYTLVAFNLIASLLAFGAIVYWIYKTVIY